MSAENFPVPVKKCPRSHSKFVTYVIHLADCVADNLSFPKPTPTVATLLEEAKALAEANGKAKGKGPGVVADRNARRKDLEGQVGLLLNYVHGEVKAQAKDAPGAAAMILSSGFLIKKNGKATMAPVAARHGRLSGEVLLVARAVKGAAMYYWEHSVDQQAWTALQGTMRARTTVSGLTPGQTYYFRFRSQGRKGMSDYSDVVKLVVI